MNPDHKQKIIERVLLAIGGIVILLLVFQAGVFVGFKKAGFMERGFPHDDIPGGHGVVGKIVKISLPTIVIEGSDNSEKVIVTDKETIIRRSRDSLMPTDMQVNDRIVVLGAPDDKGEILAKLIRVSPPLPPPPFATSSAATIR